MFASERQRDIIARLRTSGEVSVSALAAELEVSPETVRRDARLLEDRGLLRRSYGTLHVAESGTFETSLVQRRERDVQDKRNIAARAAELVGSADTVYIDEGYTPQLVGEFITGDKRRTVVTSGLQTAVQLAGRDDLDVTVVGGHVRPNTLGVVGPSARQQLDQLVFDVAFIGASGISVERGLTTPDPAVAEVKAAAIAASRRVVFVGTHLKFGASTLCRFASPADLTTIVTTRKLSAFNASRYAELGPEVVRV